jgi:hypothetical protein
MVLAQKQIWRPVEQNRGPWYESTQLRPPYFYKGPQNIWWWKIDWLFNKCCWGKWLSACRKLKLDPCLSLCTNINSKWIKDLNIRPETLKFVQKRAGNTLEAISIGKDFLNRTPAAQQPTERMDKWDYMKLKSFCTKKKWSLNWRDYPQSRRKYLPAIHQTKDW